MKCVAQEHNEGVSSSFPWRVVCRQKWGILILNSLSSAHCCNDYKMSFWLNQVKVLGFFLFILCRWLMWSTRHSSWNVTKHYSCTAHMWSGSYDKTVTTHLHIFVSPNWRRENTLEVRRLNPLACFPRREAIPAIKGMSIALLLTVYLWYMLTINTTSSVCVSVCFVSEQARLWWCVGANRSKSISLQWWNLQLPRKKNATSAITRFPCHWDQIAGYTAS